MSFSEKIQRRFLRTFGAFCGLAIFAVVMPRGWMADCHQRLGLGEFPEAPIAEYLARSTSALAAFYGGLLWTLAADVRRFGAVIRYQAWAMMALVLLGTAVMASSGMPLWWLLSDAAGVVVCCGAMLWLQARVDGRPGEK